MRGCAAALDIGFAELTAPMAALFPSLPAATPDDALSWRPAYLIRGYPPPPSRLPGIGMILFGCHLRTLINGMPAARAGDLGIAPTCGGFLPLFEITDRLVERLYRRRARRPDRRFLHGMHLPRATGMGPPSRRSSAFTNIAGSRSARSGRRRYRGGAEPWRMTMPRWPPPRGSARR